MLIYRERSPIGEAGWAAAAPGWSRSPNPARFNLPGYWLAIVEHTGPKGISEDARAVLMFGTPSGVVLSPQDPPCEEQRRALPVRQGGSCVTRTADSRSKQDVMSDRSGEVRP